MTAAGIPDWLEDGVAAAGLAGPWATREDVGGMPVLGGAYLLGLRLDRELPIALPRSAPGRLPPGWYLYAGSARGSGGLRGRLERHFRPGKKPHWHIDRLTAAAAAMAALAVAGGEECEVLGKLLDRPRFAVALPGFGSTDCRRCESHLLAAVRCLTHS